MANRKQEIHIMQQLSTPVSTSTGQAARQAAEQAAFNKMPDFYSARLNVLVLGYIRPEYDYVSAEALVEDIRVDCEVARRSLARKAYVCYLREEEGEGEGEGEDVGEVRAWLRGF
jgi:riboflavin kinase